MKEWVLALARILKGPKNFSESLCEGWVVQKNLALMKACCLTMKSGPEIAWHLWDPGIGAELRQR